MKINLKFLLNKKRIDLTKFCKINSLQSYDLLLKYCESKNIICIDEKEYNNFFPKNKKNEKKEKEIKHEPKTRRRGRKPKTKKSGNADQTSNP